MAKDDAVKPSAHSREAAPRELPRGVKLVRTLRGHTGTIGRIAWSPDGRTLASPSHDKTIRIWDVETGE
jgi:WD40 repeat protein